MAKVIEASIVEAPVTGGDVGLAAAAQQDKVEAALAEELGKSPAARPRAEMYVVPTSSSGRGVNTASGEKYSEFGTSLPVGDVWTARRIRDGSLKQISRDEFLALQKEGKAQARAAQEAEKAAEEPVSAPTPTPPSPSKPMTFADTVPGASAPVEEGEKRSKSK